MVYNNALRSKDGVETQPDRLANQHINLFGLELPARYKRRKLARNTGIMREAIFFTSKFSQQVCFDNEEKARPGNEAF